MNTMGLVGDEAGDGINLTMQSQRQSKQMTMLDSASAVVVFKVDYEQARPLPTGKAVHSDAIPAGGHTWRINFYPGGMRATTDTSRPYDRHCIALELLTSDKVVGGGVAAVFDAMVLDDQGQPALTSVRRTGRMKNNFHGTFAWLFGPDGVPAKQFVKKYVTARGYIEFRCTIRVLDDNDGPMIPVPPSGIATHLGALLDTADGADVSFTVDGETFRAHRAVVAARSPVLRAEIERCCCSVADDAATTTTTMPSVALHDIAPATFKDVLRFIYTDTLPRGDEGHDDEDAVDSWMLQFMYTDTLAGHDGDLAGGSSRIKMLKCLLAAADRYALDRLKLLCAQKLWDNVSTNTVATTLACAQMYNCPELKEKCIGFFAKESNFKKAVLTEGFVELVQQFPSIIIELRDNVGT